MENVDEIMYFKESLANSPFMMQAFQANLNEKELLELN